MRLLLVEDDVIQGKLLSDLLSASADDLLSIRCVTHLRDAVQWLRAEHFDVVLLDLNVPDSGGIDTYRAVAKACPTTAVVVFTGIDDRILALEAVREGAQDFLLKGAVDGNTIYRSALYAVERQRRERAERQLLFVQDQERKRIARDLHDSVIQTLLSLRLRLQMFSTGLGDTDCGAELRTFADDASSAADEVRRICRDLHPEVLDCRGLPEAIRWYASKLLAGQGIELELETKLDEALSPTVKHNLFRIFQEAIRNVLQHSEASKVHVALHREEDDVCLAIRDDGCGFDVSCTQASCVGLGLISLRERTELLKGSLQINSSPGGGTLVQVHVAARSCVSIDA